VRRHSQYWCLVGSCGFWLDQDCALIAILCYIRRPSAKSGPSAATSRSRSVFQQRLRILRGAPQDIVLAVQALGSRPCKPSNRGCAIGQRHQDRGSFALRRSCSGGVNIFAVTPKQKFGPPSSHFASNTSAIWFRRSRLSAQRSRPRAGRRVVETKVWHAKDANMSNRAISARCLARSMCQPGNQDDRKGFWPPKGRTGLPRQSCANRRQQKRRWSSIPLPWTDFVRL